VTPESGWRVKRLGQVDYAPALEAMKAFTAGRGPSTPDEIWLLEHPPVYTLGQAGKCEHLLQNPDVIPVLHVDRGGQITYHGPGQLLAYLLIDLPRRRLKVREFVHLIEEAAIAVAADYGLAATRRTGAPGVYVGDAKLGALGLRVKGGCSYHGLALNVDIDLTPFSWIDPCGYVGLKTTRLADFGVVDSVSAVGERLAAHFIRLLPPMRPAHAGAARG
jgi:lipoyl(octanoyl) transferase